MPNFHYKSFKATFQRDAVASVDYDPDDVRQDDYEFYTGTGRYSDNGPFIESTCRLVKAVSFEDHHTTVTYEVGKVGVTTLVVDEDDERGLSFRYWFTEEPGGKEYNGYLHLFPQHNWQVLELDWWEWK